MIKTSKSKKFECAYKDKEDNAPPKMCEELSSYKSIDGQGFCVFHYPQNDKKYDFEVALRNKLDSKSDSLNFRGCWFPSGISLQNIFADSSEGKTEMVSIMISGSPVTLTPGQAKLLKREMDFTYAVFNEKLDFSTFFFFKNLHFRHAIFNAEVIFKLARVKSIDFSFAQFNGKADFSFIFLDGCINLSASTIRSSLKFSENEKYDYSNPIFIPSRVKSKTTKINMRVKSDSHFGKNLSLIFQYAEVDNPQSILFHTINLRPLWFVNIDASKFTFTNVVWRGDKEDNKPNIKNEVESLKKLAKEQNIYFPYPYKLLAKTCRQLAINEEENHRYEESSELRYLSMDAKRLEDFDDFAFWKLYWWYWLSSGYGERWKRAFIVLIVILAISTFLYTTSYCQFKDGKQGFDIWEAISYSLRIMALQRPEPQPENSFAKVAVALQTVFAPLQLALLALAVRRKFIR